MSNRQVVVMQVMEDYVEELNELDKLSQMVMSPTDYSANIKADLESLDEYLSELVYYSRGLNEEEGLQSWLAELFVTS